MGCTVAKEVVLQQWRELRGECSGRWGQMGTALYNSNSKR